MTALPQHALDWLLAYSANVVYTDPGARAFDNMDGNITSRLSTYGVGAVSTAKPTGSSYYTTTYTVQVG